MRSLVLGRPVPGVPELVLVPGLGAVGYLLPTARRCAAWTRVHVLDVPGAGHRRTAHLPADLTSVAATVADWLSAAELGAVTLVGHSTGAQAVLRAALAVPAQVAGLVLAGPTFAPRDRRALPLLRDVLATLPHEQPGELPAVLPCYVRGARGLPVLLRTAMADRPEDAVGDVAAPVVVLRGAHDRLCTPAWARTLVERARDGRDVVLPGAHNVPWTCPVGTSEALRSAAGAGVSRRPA